MHRIRGTPLSSFLSSIPLMLSGSRGSSTQSSGQKDEVSLGLGVLCAVTVLFWLTWAACWAKSEEKRVVSVSPYSSDHWRPFTSYYGQKDGSFLEVLTAMLLPCSSATGTAFKAGLGHVKRGKRKKGWLSSITNTSWQPVFLVLDRKFVKSLLTSSLAIVQFLQSSGSCSLCFVQFLL